MNILQAVLESGNGKLAGQLATQFGISEEQASSAIGALLPSLSRGIAKNTATPTGLDSLIGAIKRGSHDRYLDDPSKLSNAETVEEGNSILGHILGSKDVSRNVAAHASKESGLDSTVLRKMLPVLAAAAMGALSKQVSNTGSEASLGSEEGSGVGSLLTSFLDADKDGSVVDDVLGMAKRLF